MIVSKYFEQFLSRSNLKRNFLANLDLFEYFFLLLAKFKILSESDLKFPTGNNSPNFPESNISFGPVWQSEEIIGTFKLWASIKTFGSPSYFDVKMNIDRGFIFPPPGGIFEVKYPSEDITGRVI